MTKSGKICSTGLDSAPITRKTFCSVKVPQDPWSYYRAMIARTIRPSGETGLLPRRRAWGDTWEDVGLPGRVNSTIWSIATHPANPLLIFCCTIFGQVFRSTDGGERWTTLEREHGDLSMLAWAPTMEATP